LNRRRLNRGKRAVFYDLHPEAIEPEYRITGIDFPAVDICISCLSALGDGRSLKPSWQEYANRIDLVSRTYWHVLVSIVPGPSPAFVRRPAGVLLDDRDGLRFAALAAKAGISAGVT
jgi:hypothetical protein